MNAPPIPYNGSVTETPVTVQFSEDSLALQFTARHGHELRYVHRWGKWLRWTGTVWQEESTMLPYDLARKVCRDNIDLPGCSDATKKTLLLSSTTAAVVRMASADRAHAGTSEQWDCDPWRLNCPTGTVDLKSGRLLKHNALDYHTKQTAVGPSSKTPERWLQFLARIFEDPEIPRYLQRVCGYMLTGSTREHAMFFAYGSGKNGKSVFSRTLAGILNSYSREASIETFTETRSDQHPTGLAALKGARLALIRETEKGSYWLESKLKEVTGGDRVTARYMRQDFFDYQPEFKLFVNGNQRPRLRTVDEAIRRRMNLIPFSVTIPENERDPNLFERLGEEWDAILNWMVQGCLEWQRNGLQAPESVLLATTEYLDDEDKVGRWLEERTLIAKTESVSKAAAYNDFVSWCEANGEKAGSKKSFTHDLVNRPLSGIKEARTMTARLFEGFSLLGSEVDCRSEY